MRHSISTKLPELRGKMLSPAKGTHKEFTSSKMATTARVSKVKSSKKSIPGIGKPAPSTSKVTSVPQEQPSDTTGDDMGHTSRNIPAVPVLRSPPTYQLCVPRTPTPTESFNISVDNTTNSDNVSGSEVISHAAAGTACNALVSVPSTRKGNPKPPSRPGSTLAQGLPRSLPLTHPPSRATTPLIPVVNYTSVISPLRLMS